MSDCRRQTLSKTETHHSGGLNLGAFRTDFAAQSPAWQDFERRRKEYGSRSGPSRRQTLSPPASLSWGPWGRAGLAQRAHTPKSRHLPWLMMAGTVDGNQEVEVRPSINRRTRLEVSLAGGASPSFA